MSLTYEDSGVNKNAGYEEVKLIKPLIKKTFTEGVLSNLGGFSGLFEIDKNNYINPVLVSGTDGVGTKLKLAFLMDKHNTIGEDCVAMCVNDILCQGAKPLFFLDYISTGKLIPEKMYSIVEGVSNGCVKSKCSLIGGETAEMPGLYEENEYDLAGFSLGIVDKDKIINGKENIKENDIILALPSSGVHSNGFSLIRKIIFDKMKFELNMNLEKTGKTLGEELLTPTKIYVEPILQLIEKFEINGICHITGGGLYENIPRVLPNGLTAKINLNKIKVHEIFKLLQKWGEVTNKEMYSTFNMGVGMVIVVNKDIKDDIIEFFTEINEEIYEIGEIIKGDEGVILWS